MRKRSDKPDSIIAPLLAGHAGQRTAIAGTEEYTLDQIESFAQDDVVHDEDDVDAEPERAFSESDRPCTPLRVQPRPRHKRTARPKIRS